MFKQTALFSAIILLTACGGGSSGGSSEPLKLTLVNTSTSYSAVRIDNGDWQKLAVGNNAFTLPDDGAMVSVITICQDSNRYDVDMSQNFISQSLSSEIDSCDDASIENPEVTFSYVAPGIGVQYLDVSDSMEINSNGRVVLNQKNTPRTVVATGYRASDQKAFFFKRTNWTLADGDTPQIDFTDENYAAEVSYEVVADKNGFNYNLDYELADISLPLSLYSADNYPVISIPASMRSAGDMFRVNWQFGDDSAYNRYLSNPDTVLELAAAPAEPELSDVVFTQDGTSATISYQAWNFDDLSPSQIHLEFDTYDSATGTYVDTDYYLEPSINDTDSFSFTLLDLNSLPEMTLNIPAVSKDDLAYWFATLDNGKRYETGARMLQLTSLDNRPR
ncbi:hypothetical protein [Thalassolituus hydrocarboniclasticus]|uniref:Uncharacterized protein n=1 Tax=Thalassolituus hydrocarboniclasticus TaxID=2742796 RepID=A0ABY6A3Y8_9GAMM|nr:hypothetical protein [Thalassolituus hydrocarboniclasticus]UXD85941.1 hypothetical protein HUF19_00070 [Thalassolituus hydrocarboniclasticus]